MAEAFLTPVIERLSELLTEEVRLLKGVDEEVESLKKELEIIQQFVKDTEAKLDRGGMRELVKVWMKQRRELGNRIEDVIDDYIRHVGRRGGERGLSVFIMKVCHCIKTLKLRMEIASEITNIKEELRKMKDRAQTFGLQPLELQGSSSRKFDADELEDDELRLGSLFIPKDELVGIDSTTKELVSKLVEGHTRLVISLVGEGGIGKTTLAKNVYNNEVVIGHFDCRAWISVSQTYNTKKLLREMIRQILPAAEHRARGIDRIEELVSLLKEHLETKKYVIVFDDVWRDDFWSRVMKHAVPAGGRNQGRIIVTTRSATIASAFRETPHDLVQELKPWSKELAWKLFCKKAFRHEIEEQCPEELKQLSLKIVSKCQGLPLVIATLGSLLSVKEKDKSIWGKVLEDLEDLNSEFRTTTQLTDISKILFLSYFDLPDHLKRCFLYFGIFPKNSSTIDVTLYKLWIAEGFVEAKSGKTLEEVAEEYLSELIQRNLVQLDMPNEVERWFRVHALMRDVILSRAKETSFFQIADEKETTLTTAEESRRLAIYNTTGSVLESVKGDGLHSISIFDVDNLTKSFVVTLLKRFKRLRVLNFHGASLDELPNEIGDLFHLKYLRLWDTKVKKIPKSIGKLHDLQTLDIRYSLVSELPREINKLRKLRYLLGFSFEKNLFHGVRIQGGVGNLRVLETLSMVKAHPGGDGLMILIKDLEKLTEMRQLGISELTKETGWAVCAAIEKMVNLKCLDLHAINEDEILDLQNISNPPPLLEYLALKGKLQGLPDWIPRLQNLQKLSLSRARLTDEPLTFLKDMPRLVYLNLDAAYDGEELHFENDGFQKLKEINLKNLKWLKVVKIDQGALSHLEKLEIGPSLEMKEVPTDIINLRKLKYLDIWEMPREFVAAMQPDGGEHFWKIKNVARVRFWRKDDAGDYVEYKLSSSNAEPLKPALSGSNAEPSKPALSDSNPEPPKPALSGSNAEPSKPALSDSNPEPPKPALSGSKPKQRKLWDHRHPFAPVLFQFSPRKYWALAPYGSAVSFPSSSRTHKSNKM